GTRTFKLCSQYVDEMVQVNTDEICSGIKTIYQETRSIVEPAGALAVAGLKKYIETRKITGQHLVAVNSGANMNFDRLRFVAERTQIGEKKEALYAVSIPEEPGALRHFCTHLLEEQNITEFNYRLSDRRLAYIFVGLSVRDTQQRHEFFNLLSDAGYDCLDMTDNDLAKTHVRYMVGGHSQHVGQEFLYRFWFPERPGALAKFLAAIGSDWNISLFHYRAQGGDFGRVLVGMELPDGTHGQLNDFLDSLGYYYIEETDNLAYKRFLQGG
ncbi:MAG: PLP-dependent threonine dehydratase, partial [Desulfobacteraceae bacterium 4572_35.1]